MTGRRDGLALAEWELAECRRRLALCSHRMGALVTTMLWAGHQPSFLRHAKILRAELTRWHREERRLLAVVAREAEAEGVGVYWRAWSAVEGVTPARGLGPPHTDAGPAAAPPAEKAPTSTPRAPVGSGGPARRPPRTCGELRYIGESNSSPSEETMSNSSPSEETMSPALTRPTGAQAASSPRNEGQAGGQEGASGASPVPPARPRGSRAQLHDLAENLAAALGGAEQLRRVLR